MRTSIKGNVSEIYSSIQGEGLYVGLPFIFVRLSGCNLRCSYCDTLYSRKRSAGRLMSAEEALGRVASLGSASRDVCITGGEPLLQPDFLRQLLAGLRKAGYRTHLETNGTRLDSFRKVAPLLDVVCFCAKRSGTLNGYAGRFIRSAYRSHTLKGRGFFVKKVITERTVPQEIEGLAVSISGVDRHIPLVLQPVSIPSGRNYKILERRDLACLAEMALRHLSQARLIPQVHRVMKMA